jgi:hypothetical protein
MTIVLRCVTSERVRQLARRTASLMAAGFVLGGPVAHSAPGPDGDRGFVIMREQRRVNSGYVDEVIRYKMALVNANGDRSERVLEVRTLESTGGTGDRTLIVFHEPADIKGTALLTHESRDGDDDQWLYLPAVKRIRRIASSNRASSFVGSEFTYEDLTPNELTKYQYRYLRDDSVAGAAVWVIESTPRFEDSGYARRELFVRADNHQTTRINFYDKKGALIKVGTYERWFRVGGKRWRAGVLRADNVQTGKSTVLETLEARIGTGLSPRDFTTNMLGK